LAENEKRFQPFPLVITSRAVGALTLHAGVLKPHYIVQARNARNNSASKLALENNNHYKGKKKSNDLTIIRNFFAKLF